MAEAGLSEPPAYPVSVLVEVELRGEAVVDEAKRRVALLLTVRWVPLSHTSTLLFILLLMTGSRSGWSLGWPSATSSAAAPPTPASFSPAGPP